jgi:hypothetical protein
MKTSSSFYLQVDVAGSSKTSITIYQTTRPHTLSLLPEDGECSSLRNVDNLPDYTASHLTFYPDDRGYTFRWNADNYLLVYTTSLLLFYLEDGS